MDADEIRHRFEETGVIRMDAAFTPDEAAAMRDVIWRYAHHKAGVRFDDPSTWPEGAYPGVSWKGLKRNRAFLPLIENAALLTALEAIFGVGGWTPPKPGAQVLCTLPQPGPWVLPDAWHMDCGFEKSTWPVFAVKLFAFFGEVGPEGGGTMVLPGSHRLVDRYRTKLPPGTGGGKTNWRPFMKHDPWLAQLLEGKRMPDGGRSLVGQTREIDGIPVEVTELTGWPGDVVLTHLHIFHTASPNTGPQPRQMLGKAISAQETPAQV
ncbi:phytanoyl-CoA dioxygenase family protein [Actinopolymorpha sp. B11F2]|uniref:phytanoyl-CoA dioxygenase family protein n=1 Tax=Actinopolymorpha sp. B11F2 TaxID=3160862 RepID=UPI0032E3B7E6